MSKGAPYVCSLSPELQQKARDELNERSDWRHRDIQALRDMILTHPGLKCKTDDAFLLRFLRARKFDYERTYKLVIDYFKIRAENPDLFINLKPSTIKHVIEAGVMLPLPVRDKQGRRVILLRTAKWNPEQYPIWDVIRAQLVNLEILLMDEETQVLGCVLIQDMSDISWAHVKQFDRTFAKLMTSVTQDSFPARFKGMHIANEPSFFTVMYAVIKPFLREKYAARLTVHGSDRESLYKQFGKESLPEDLGGNLSMEKIKQDWLKTILSHEAFFEELSQCKIEVVRQINNNKKSDTSVEAVTGTFFRKLNVD